MGWLRDIQKVLGIAAPELVLATVVLGTSTTSGHLVPFAGEVDFHSLRKFDELTWFLREHSQVERSLVTSPDGLSVDVWHNNVVNWLVLVGWAQRQSASDFTLLESLETLSSLVLDVVAIDLPKTVAFGANTHNQEVDGDVVFA